MRSLAWVTLIALFLVGVALPGVYLMFSSRLPQLESEYDLENLLRGYIEGERMSVHAGEAGLKTLNARWPRPEIERIPTGLVDLALTEMGCPSFFQTPRETTQAAAWRALSTAFLHRDQPGANGRCEYALAFRVAQEARIVGDIPQAIAAFRIRGFLAKDKLVAYALATFRANWGIFGVEDLSQDLFHRPVKDLTLAQLAELMLAAPPNDYYQDIQQCRNPILIRKARDAILDRLGKSGLVAENEVRAAKQQTLYCIKD